jgi:branched-chain amino acid transport system permease protein
MISAGLGGIAGSIYAQYIGIVTPEIFGFGHMVDVLLIIVIGGTGGFFGPMLAAFLVISVPEVLRSFEAYRLPTYGLILLITILFLPRGLGSLGSTALVRRLRRTDRMAAASHGD